MPNYKVTWEIDVQDAIDPIDAAEEAWAALRRPTTIANVFVVTDVATGHATTVDLTEALDERERAVAARLAKI